MASKDNSLLFTAIITIIFIGLVAVVIQFDIVTQLLRLTQPKSLTVDNKKVTYYQWFEKGEMVIRRSPPAAQQAYITFEGDPKLTQSRYQVDPLLIAKAEAFRKTMLKPKIPTDDDSQQLITALLTEEQRSLLATDGHCRGLQTWLKDISGVFTHYEDQSNQQFCEQFEERLVVLNQIGCRTELAEFKSQICGKYQ